MAYAVEARPSFVVRLDHIPGRFLRVRVPEHLVFSFRVVDPPCPRFEIHGAELPALTRVVNAAQETAFLFFITDREPVFDQDDARIN